MVITPVEQAPLVAISDQVQAPVEQGTSNENVPFSLEAF